MPYALPRTVPLLVIQGVPWTTVRSEMHLRSSLDCARAYQVTSGGEMVFGNAELATLIANRIRERATTFQILREFDAEIFHYFRLRAERPLGPKDIYCWCELFALVLEHIVRHHPEADAALLQSENPESGKAHIPPRPPEQ